MIAECAKCGVLLDYKHNSDLIERHHCAERTWPGGPSRSDPVEMDYYRCRREGHITMEICFRCGEILSDPEVPA